MALTKANFYKPSVKPIKLETSWDDGGKLDLRVAELLKKYNLEGIFYVVVDWVGKEGYLSWEEIKTLKEQGFRIGSHTLNHPADLKDLHNEQLFVEVQNSKDLLETALGSFVESFCYPRGRWDSRVREAVIDAGYLEARGTGKPGITEINDVFNLPGTIHIFQREEYGELSLVDYAKKVIDKVKSEGGYINIWGHSAEIERNGNWDKLEIILQYAAEKLK